MSQATAKLYDVQVEITALERELAKAQDKLKQLDEAYFNNRRMLLIRMDGSMENAGAHIAPDGRPLREYCRDRFAVAELPPAHHAYAPVPCRRERFVLMGQVGRLYIYGEV